MIKRRVAPLPLVAPLALAALTASPLTAAPVVDQAAGRFTDEFLTSDRIPGPSFASATGVAVLASGGEAYVTLALGGRPAEDRNIVQTSWSGGAQQGASADLGGTTGFTAESPTVLWENTPGELTVTTAIVAQEGLSPFKRPVAPVRTAEAVEDYYAYNGASSDGPQPETRTSLLALHRDARRGEGALSIVVTNHRAAGFSLDQASVYVDFAELPAGSELAVADDGSELTLQGTSAAGRWTWSECCTDGGAIRLAGSEFVFALSVVDGRRTGTVPGTNPFASWIDNYPMRFLSDDAAGFDDVDLEKPPTPASIPGPPVYVAAALGGAIESAVFDTGAREADETRAFTTAGWDADVPQGGALELRVRDGDTPEAATAASWSAPVTQSGASIASLLPAARRYVQYRVDVALPDPAARPRDPEPVARIREVRLTFRRTFAVRLAQSGEATSVDVAPTRAPLQWRRLEFDATPGGRSELAVDVLSGVTGATLIADAAPSQDLGAIGGTAHRRLRLRVRMSTQETDQALAPRLLRWEVTWTPDPDRDGDGLLDPVDNCPDVPNADQSNRDGDALGDVCDPCPAAAVHEDADRDGVAACAGDCDDTRPDVAPGRAEVCDGRDNDCDGRADVSANGTPACECSPGDTRMCEGGGADGRCSGGTQRCTAAGTWGPCEGAPEPSPEECNGLDDDCDGATDEDFDGDGDGSATCDGDCDDGDAGVFPGATETCNGIDDNCDGVFDPGCRCAVGDFRPCGLDEGACQGGFQFCNPLGTGWSDCVGAVGPVPEVCDAEDNDCDALTDEGFDADGDRVATCAGDCDDGDARVFPGAPEACDGADNNCTGVADEGCACTAGERRTCGVNVGVCRAGTQVCSGGTWGTCEGGVLPVPERCDDTDNNCDGATDEDFDLDEDGVTTCDGDCDDRNAAAHPGAREVCDGADNDCNGTADEGCPCRTGDTVACGSDEGACQRGAQLCIGGNWTGCNGAQGPVPEQCNVADDDCDGDTDEDFDTDADGVTTCGGDCDDTRRDVRPGATERCNALDDNCDGVVDEGFDADGDGVAGCAGDCDDGDANVFPGAEEACDGVDNNCDGAIDTGCECNEGDARACGSTGEGECQRGTQLCDLGAWGACQGAIEPVPEVCDGRDNDCDAATDEDFDRDGDGHASCTGDCDDADPAVAPGAPERCNARDDNCNGVADEGCECVVGETRVCGSDEGGCVAGRQVCAEGVFGPCEGEVGAQPEGCNGADDDCDGATDEDFDADADGVASCAGDCDDGDGRVAPGLPEACDALDNDCNGVVDDGCDCVHGTVETCGSDEGVCRRGARLCTAGFWGACEGSVEPSAEVCDALDNDCDARTDEEFDLDRDGATTCGGDCDDRDSARHPAAAETCNAVDDNCDGRIDPACECLHGTSEACGTDEGECRAGRRACTFGEWSACAGAIAPREEVCDGLDNNCDAATDEGLDGDRDGFLPCGDDATRRDCDDTDRSVNPGAAEVCDGLDNNCDLSIDEGFDADGDGWSACRGDCRDGDAGVNPAARERCNVADDDCDGLVDEGLDGDGDGFAPCGPAERADCDDGDARVRPGAVERCNGRDDDCDGAPDEGVVVPPEACGDAGVCRDAEARCDAGAVACTFPPEFEREEARCDGLDNDCDGAVDEAGCPCLPGDARTCGAPDDAPPPGADGCTPVQRCGDDGTWGACEAARPPEPEVCDGLDNNCDGATDEGFDADGDGVNACDGDCDDDDPDVRPGASEVCDGRDNDCNGRADEADDRDADGFAPCGAQADCDDDDAAVFPGAIERCDERDNDCDGLVDTDAVSPPGTCPQLGVCAGATAVCALGGWLCQFPPSWTREEGARACDGLDNDCDGLADEECSCERGWTRACSGDVGECRAGGQVCLPAGVWGPCSGVMPAAEACDGRDNDCDVAVDEDFDEDGDFIGPCGDAPDCDENDPAVHPGAPERCNGVDDNCDGVLLAGERGGEPAQRCGSDGDGDGVLDADDVCPAAPDPDQRDEDGDGRGDACDACARDAADDADGDGVCADGDNCAGAANADQADLDADGTGDACDPDFVADADALRGFDGALSGGACTCRGGPGAGGGTGVDAVWLAVVAWGLRARRRLRGA